MQLIDLFAGIGAFSLAGKQVWGDELEILGFSEIEHYPIQVYQKNFPGVPNLGDIKKINGKAIKFSGPSIITGGFPCPPFSHAGNRRGKEDDRFIWDQMFRIISETRSDWVIAENVAGLLSLGIEDCISDLENQGYETSTFLLPACAIGAPHIRNRVFIIAHTNCIPIWKQPGGCNGKDREEKIQSGFTSKEQNQSSGIGDRSFNCNGLRAFADTHQQDFPWEQISTEQAWEGVSNPGWNYFKETESPVLGIHDGVPRRMDRIKSLGNSIVVPLLVIIMEAIKQIETIKRKEKKQNTKTQ